MLAARTVASVTSAAVKGAEIVSMIVPCIFPIIIDEEECENDCCITCMAINPGARKLIKFTPKTLPLSLPIANERTSKNNKDVINGEKSVCIQTAKNLKTSFLYNVQKPIQLTKPNLLSPISYFLFNSTIAKHIYYFFYKIVKKLKKNIEIC